VCARWRHVPACRANRDTCPRRWAGRVMARRTAPVRSMLTLARRLAGRRRRPGQEMLEASGLFDRAGYLARYPDVAASGVDPLQHYLDTGAQEGRVPCDFFDGAWYLSTNPDVAAAGLDPFVHFCEFGWRESRHPGPDFDLDWYAQAHLADAAGAINPLAHYLGTGRAMGLEIRPVRNPDAVLILEAG